MLVQPQCRSFLFSNNDSYYYCVLFSGNCTDIFMCVLCFLWMETDGPEQTKVHLIKLKITKFYAAK